VTSQSKSKSTSNDWRRLAEQASVEPDPAKLLTIVEVLNRVLDREATFRHAYRKGVSTKVVDPVTGQ
jgi:hypothetical protein